MEDIVLMKSWDFMARECVFFLVVIDMREYAHVYLLSIYATRLGR